MMSWESSIVGFNCAHIYPKQSVPSLLDFWIAHAVNLKTSHLEEVIFSLDKLENVGFT